MGDELTDTLRELADSHEVGALFIETQETLDRAREILDGNGAYSIGFGNNNRAPGVLVFVPDSDGTDIHWFSRLEG